MAQRYKARWGKPFGYTNPGFSNPTFVQTIIAIEGEIQDEETYTWGPQRVYVVRAGDSLKIGVTQNLKQRIREIQTHNSSQIELVGALVGGELLERLLHDRFKHHHIRGEWFTLGALPELLDMIAADKDYFEMRGVQIAA